MGPHRIHQLSSVIGIQGGQDASSCRTLFAKEPLIIGLFWGKWPIRRYPMGLRHSVMIIHGIDVFYFGIQIMPMIWLRLVGSSKWQVSFAEYSLFSWALLQKRPIIFFKKPTNRSDPIWVIISMGLSQCLCTVCARVWLSAQTVRQTHRDVSETDTLGTWFSA